MKRTVISILVVVLLLAVAAPVLAAEYDFGGETVTYVAWWNIFADVKERIAEAEQLFNVKVKLHPIYPWEQDYTQALIARLLAGDATNDIWVIQNMVAYYDLLANNAIFPVSEILPSDYYDKFNDAEAQLMRALDFRGKTYTFGHGLDTPYPHHMWMVLYNKELLERENQPDVYELYKAGEWTWDKMTEIARAVTRDTDGDGTTDQFGLKFLNVLMPTILGVTNGASVTREDASGKVVFTFDEEPAIEALEQAYQWRTVDKIVGGDDPALFAGKVAMDIIPVYGLFERRAQLVEAGERFALAPLPMGPRADRHAYPQQAIEGRVMSADVENPEALIALDAFIFEGETDTSMDEYMLKYAFNRQSAEVLLEALEKFSGEANFFMEGVLGGAGFHDTVDQVLNGVKGAKVAMSEIKPAMQSKLDTLFGQ